MKKVSVSQVNLFQGCPARWGARYLEGLKEPEDPARQFGTDFHAEMEAWSKHGTLPTTPAALQALPLAPSPHDGAGIEHEFASRPFDATYFGIVDVAWESRALVQDWKTTSKLSNAKSVSDLLNDNQANLYAAAMGSEWQLDTVTLRWVYVARDSKSRPKPVETQLETQKALDFVQESIEPTAVEIQKLYQLRPKWQEMEKKTGYCYAFRKQCYLYDQCKPATQRIQIPAKIGGKMDFKSKIMSAFPGAAPAAPQPPVAYAPPPPLPPAAAAFKPSAYTPPVHPALPVPDAGFVNPPHYAPPLAASPEQAAAIQGIVPPGAAPAPEADDLDGKSRDELKVIAVAMGVISPDSRAREASIRDTIRAARRAGVQAPAPAAPPPPSDSWKATPPYPETYMHGAVVGSDHDGAQVVHRAPPPTPKPVVHEPVVQDIVGQMAASFAALKPSTEPFYPAARDTPIDVLYVDCAPNERCAHLSELVAVANQLIKEQSGEEDYRLVQYGAGPGHLACAVEDLVRAESDAVGVYRLVMDSHTQEGMALLNTLHSLSKIVVRSTR